MAINTATIFDVLFNQLTSNKLYDLKLNEITNDKMHLGEDTKLFNLIYEKSNQMTNKRRKADYIVRNFKFDNYLSIIKKEYDAGNIKKLYNNTYNLYLILFYMCKSPSVNKKYVDLFNTFDNKTKIKLFSYHFTSAISAFEEYDSAIVNFVSLVKLDMTNVEVKNDWSIFTNIFKKIDFLEKEKDCIDLQTKLVQALTKNINIEFIKKLIRKNLDKPSFTKFDIYFCDMASLLNDVEYIKLLNKYYFNVINSVLSRDNLLKQKSLNSITLVDLNTTVENITVEKIFTRLHILRDKSLSDIQKLPLVIQIMSNYKFYRDGCVESIVLSIDIIHRISQQHKSSRCIFLNDLKTYFIELRKTMQDIIYYTLDNSYDNKVDEIIEFYNNTVSYDDRFEDRITMDFIFNPYYISSVPNIPLSNKTFSNIIENKKCPFTNKNLDMDKEYENNCVSKNIIEKRNMYIKIMDEWCVENEIVFL